MSNPEDDAFAATDPYGAYRVEPMPPVSPVEVAGLRGTLAELIGEVRAVKATCAELKTEVCYWKAQIAILGRQQEDQRAENVESEALLSRALERLQDELRRVKTALASAAK